LNGGDGERGSPPCCKRYGSRAQSQTERSRDYDAGWHQLHVTRARDVARRARRIADGAGVTETLKIVIHHNLTGGHGECDGRGTCCILRRREQECSRIAAGQRKLETTRRRGLAQYRGAKRLEPLTDGDSIGHRDSGLEDVCEQRSELARRGKAGRHAGGDRRASCAVGLKFSGGTD
jgi:hypothetical protein